MYATKSYVDVTSTRTTEKHVENGKQGRKNSRLTMNDIAEGKIESAQAQMNTNDGGDTQQLVQKNSNGRT